MHIYLYDSYVNQKKFHKIISKIETRITDLGLNGKIIRLNTLNNISDTVLNEIKNNAKTIICVGNDQTFHKTINAIAKINSVDNNLNLPIGFIPINKEDNIIGNHLGIDPGEKACDLISARRTLTMDLGLINNKIYFLTEVVIPAKHTSIEINESYSLETINEGVIHIINLPTTSGLNNSTILANDNKLELFIKTKQKNIFFGNNENKSIFNFKQLRILNKKYPAKIDNCLDISCPIDIKLAKEKIKIIIGKNRNF